MNYDEHVKLQQLFDRLNAIMTNFHGLLSGDLADMIVNTTIVKFGDDCRSVDLVLLNQKIDDLNLSVRASNCLYGAKILHVGSLAAETRKSLLALPNFGQKCLHKVEMLLNGMNLSLGAVYYDWLPPKETLMRVLPASDEGQGRQCRQCRQCRLGRRIVQTGGYDPQNTDGGMTPC